MAENRFSVSRISSTEKAPVPMPDVPELEARRRVHQRRIRSAQQRQTQVSRVRKHLQHAEDPERVPQARQRRHPPTHEGAADGRNSVIVASATPR